MCVKKFYIKSLFVLTFFLSLFIQSCFFAAEKDVRTYSVYGYVKGDILKDGSSALTRLSGIKYYVEGSKVIRYTNSDGYYSIDFKGNPGTVTLVFEDEINSFKTEKKSVNFSVEVNLNIDVVLKE